VLAFFFRYANKEKLEELLNSQYVDRLEIVMKEQIGCKGTPTFKTINEFYGWTL